MGVAEHKRRKNEACSRGIVERYAGDDFVGIQVDADAKIVAVPRPAGVVLALTPSTNPIATVYFKVLLSLMTRNAVVVSPHPLARRVCAEAVAPARRGGGRRGRARRLPAGRRGADDPADRGADVRRRGRRDRRHRRHRGRARRLPLGQPVARRRPRQRAGAGRRHRRRRPGRALPGRLEGVRQLDPVHERVGRDRRGARGRRARARAGAQRRARARRGGGRARPARRSTPRGGSTPRWPARTPPRWRPPPRSACRAARACWSRRSR